MENDLNTTLLKRDGRKSLLTEAGKNFLPFAEKILEQYQKGIYKLNQQLYIPDQISIGCSNSVSSYLLPEIIPHLINKFPELNITIQSYHSEEVVSKVLNKEVDFGIVREITHPKINSILILNSHVGLYASPDHPLIKMQERMTKEDLSNYEFVFYDHNSTDWLLISRLLEPVKIQRKIIIHVDNMEAAKRLVKKNMGLCFLPEHAVQEELDNGTIVQVPIDCITEVSTKISIIYLNEKEKSPIVELIEELYN